MDDTICSICFTDINNGITRINCECTGVYHSKCIMLWLLQNQTCPTCRKYIENLIIKNNDISINVNLDEEPQEGSNLLYRKTLFALCVYSSVFISGGLLLFKFI